MPPNSGTPTSWLLQLSAKVVNVHCECEADLAAERFIRRQRHQGHLDSERSHSEIRATIRAAALLGRLNVGPRVDVDTSLEPDLAVLNQIRKALENPYTDR